MARAPSEVGIGMGVVVVGSINRDLTVSTRHHPRPGETVLGQGHRWGGGGKGANQAVAAARLGSATGIIGRVGNDESGRVLTEALRAEGIDVSCVSVDDSEPTGLAVITVDDEAENSIVVSPGANMRLAPRQVAECSSMLEHASVVLAQLEVPVESVAEAARCPAKIFCLNPAPARELSQALLELVDVLVPNRVELAALASVDVPIGRDAVTEAARRIEGPAAVIVTLGHEGAIVITDDEVTPVPPVAVATVDTTGAGDAFCGALASSLARGDDLIVAAEWATRAGALATTKHGAYDAMPTREELGRI